MQRTRQNRSLGWTAGMLTAAVAFGGCTDSTPSSRTAPTALVPRVRSAMARSGGGDIVGDMKPRSGSRVTIRGAWDGKPLGAGSGHMEAGVATTHGTEPVSVRWVGGAAYIDRQESRATAGSTATSPFLTHRAGEPAWLHVASPESIEALVDPFVPTQVLGQLEPRDLQDIGSESGATHLRSREPVSLVSGWAPGTVDLWVAGNRRITKVSFSSKSGTLGYRVSKAGRPTPTEAPPATEVAEMVPPPAGTVAPIGPSLLVRRGTGGGVTWELRRAPGSIGAVCWQISTTPVVPIAEPNAGDARCQHPPSRGDDAQDRVQFVLSDRGLAEFDLMVATVPSGSSHIVVGYVGGRVERYTGPQPIVAIAPAGKGPGYLGVTLAGGTSLDCGRGGIATRSDLTDDFVTGKLAGTPWTCAPRTHR